MNEMKLSALHKSELFESIFPIEPLILASIQDHMKEFGYDVSQPIVIWKGKNVIVDGHTRYAAASNLDLEVIPVYEYTFNSEEEALKYIVHSQRNRRNLTDSEMIKILEQFRQRNASEKGLTTKKLSELLGIGYDKVKRANNVMKDEELKDSVINGDTSIEGAYNELKQKKKDKKEKEVYDEGYDYDPSEEVPEINITEKTREPTNFNGEKSKFQLHLDGDFAKWAWQPVAGCEYDCPYCLAKEHLIKIRGSFEPKFYPGNLDAPLNMSPDTASFEIPDDKVVVCPNGDLFGPWVPDLWIEKVLNVVKKASKWTFLFTTQTPERLKNFNFYDNCWVGVTVSRQSQIEEAEKGLKAVKAPIKYLMCRPLEEKLLFTSLNDINWVIIGDRLLSEGRAALQPEWLWVELLILQARKAKCLIYMYPTLKLLTQEIPES